MCVIAVYFPRINALLFNFKYNSNHKHYFKEEKCQ